MRTAAVSPGMLVRILVPGDLFGRYGIAFERQPKEVFRVRVCTTMEEPLKIIRAPGKQLEAIELCVLLCACIRSEEALERFELALESVNPLLQNDVDADYRPLLLVSYAVDERFESSELVQRLSGWEATISAEILAAEEAGSNASGPTQLPENRAVVRRLPLSDDLHFGHLLREVAPLVPKNSWCCFQDERSLSCSTRLAAFLDMVQKMPVDAKIGVLDVQAGWWPGRKTDEHERPRNAEEVDQLFECQAVGIAPANCSAGRLYPYLFRGEACFGPLQEKDTFPVTVVTSESSACELLVGQKDEKIEVYRHQPINFESFQYDGDEPLDWGYMPDALL